MSCSPATGAAPEAFRRRDYWAKVTGRYLKWQQDLRASPEAYDETLQESLLSTCAKLTGAALPG